jgi:large subunit ribosomal protein L44
LKTQTDKNRILASTGKFSQAPIFNIGLFLPSGVKLAEGFGSSFQMAEHRAAVNALLSMFLVKSDQDQNAKSTLPTSIHSDLLLSNGKLSAGKEVFTPVKVEGETIVESSRRLRQ